MSEFSIQVQTGHYVKPRYLTKDRWINYWYQWYRLQRPEIKTVLEIGVGNGVVAELFQKTGMEVTTVDIDASLHPTQVASVTALPYADHQFDAILCAEVLEHLPFEQSLRGMRELHRVTKRWVLITLPHAGYVFSLTAKFPLCAWWSWIGKIPFFWKHHEFQGEHYWELGKKGWSRARLCGALESVGFTVHDVRMYADDPAHVFFWCEKNQVT